MNLQSGARAALPEDPDCISSTQWGLTTVYNSNARGSDTLLQPLRAPHTYKHAGSTPIHVLKNDKQSEGSSQLGKTINAIAPLTKQILEVGTRIGGRIVSSCVPTCEVNKARL